MCSNDTSNSVRVQEIEFVKTSKKYHKMQKLYLFEFFDKPGSFNTTLHIKADVHFDFSKGVSQFDDGNLRTHTQYRCWYWAGTVQQETVEPLTPDMVTW